MDLLASRFTPGDATSAQDSQKGHRVEVEDAEEDIFVLLVRALLGGAVWDGDVLDVGTVDVVGEDTARLGLDVIVRKEVPSVTKRDVCWLSP
jgi:hypothetical protein